MSRRVVLVCGGRDYSNIGHVFKTLDSMHVEKPITCIVHGAARGADSLADAWARERKVAIRSFPAQWSLRGKQAGPIRNQRMLDAMSPSLVVAFPGGAGTLDMTTRARAAGVIVLEATP